MPEHTFLRNSEDKLTELLWRAKFSSNHLKGKIEKALITLSLFTAGDVQLLDFREEEWMNGWINERIRDWSCERFIIITTTVFYSSYYNNMPNSVLRKAPYKWGSWVWLPPNSPFFSREMLEDKSHGACSSAVNNYHTACAKALCIGSVITTQCFKWKFVQ